MSIAHPETSLLISDMQGMMEVLRDLSGNSIDILLHSPGGSPDATAAIVHYLRTKFDDVRIFVPLAAMSAATMWALAADRIVMGKHSQLGPIDPQIQLPTTAGPMNVPARAIIKQFDLAKEELESNQKYLPAWLPLIQQYPPGLLQICRDSEALSKKLVREWLAKYMFRDLVEHEGAQKASEIADYFADAGEHLSHGLGIYRDAAVARGLKIDALETDQALQDAVLSVHHATIHTMSGANVAKVIENNLDRAYIRQIPAPVQIQFGQGPMLPIRLPIAPAPTPPSPPSPPSPPAMLSLAPHQPESPAAPSGA